MFKLTCSSVTVRAVLMPFLLLASSCGAQKPFAWGRVEQGEVLTSGVVIRADNGSFQYAAGPAFPTPINVSDCPRVPNTSNWTLVPDAQRVTVFHPASPRPLHGLLAFCPAPPASDQPSGRSHGIQIPEKYVLATGGGLTSVVFDVVSYEWDYRAESGGIESFSEWPTWILWLRQDPFPGGVGGAVPHGAL